MKSLQNLNHLLNGLSTKERKVIRRHVCAFDTESKDKTLSIKLLRYIEKHPDNLEYSKVVAHLYGKDANKAEDAFRKLVDRVRDKAYEATILDVNIDHHPYYVPLTIASLQVRKALSLLYSILIKGIQQSERKRIIESSIKLCYQFELFDELVIVLKHKYEELDLSEGYKIRELRIEEIEKCILYSNYIFKSKNYVSLFIYDTQYKSLDQSDLLYQIEAAANELFDVWEKTKLNNVLYNYYQLRAQYAHYVGNYDLALEVLTKVKELLMKEKSVFTMGKMTLCITNLAYTQSYLFRFNEALRNMILAREYYSSQRPEFINFYKESEVFLNIYLKNYPEALDLLQQIKGSEVEGMELQASRTNYLLAVVMFLMGDYKKSNFLLQDTREIEGDKEGWNIGIRMLQIFLTLQTEKVDLADQRIGSLRKHIERTIKMKSVRKRDVVIFRILSHLSRSGFDFKEVWEERQKDFQLLRSNDADYRWIPRSHELILFDQWFESKVKRRDYAPVFPSPVENDAPLTN